MGTLQNKLKKAREEAEQVYPLTRKQRLDRLGLLYVLIDERRQSSSSKLATSTPAKASFASPSPRPFNTTLPSQLPSYALPPTTPVVAKKSSPDVSKKSSPVVAKKSSPVMAKKSSPVVAKKTSLIVAKKSTPVVAKKSTPVLARKS